MQNSLPSGSAIRNQWVPCSSSGCIASRRAPSAARRLASAAMADPVDGERPTPWARCHAVVVGSLGVVEVLIVVAVALLVFGSSRVPKMVRSIRDGMRERRNAGRDGRKPAN